MQNQLCKIFEHRIIRLNEHRFKGSFTRITFSGKTYSHTHYLANRDQLKNWILQNMLDHVLYYLSDFTNHYENDLPQINRIRAAIRIFSEGRKKRGWKLLQKRWEEFAELFDDATDINIQATIDSLTKVVVGVKTHKNITV